MNTVGDMARTLLLRTHHTRLNREMDQLGVELATGFVRDPATHLAGDVTGLVAIDRTLAQLEAFRLNTAEASLLAGTMQTTLSEIQTRAEAVSQVLLSAALTPSSEMLSTLSEEASNAFGQMVSGLNRGIGGRYLFAGTTTDTPPLADPEAMLADLRGALAGETTVAGVDAALDAWFGSGGGFETMCYLGSQDGLAPLRLSRTETAALDIRADNQVFRDVLKMMAKAALATDPTLGLPLEVQTGLMAKAGRDLLQAQAPVVELRAGLGALEARIEETTTRNAAETTAMSLARLDLVGIDQFDTAARYENTRSQLEALYAITVRSSRMSLTEFF
ncbi:flagellin [Salipiger marinus]|uniref:flagellin n=1 Tax=Salipiger marinus TaxID=555512 RepID=UPI002BF75D4B|nr:flagellin [Salipiger manganoxidans]MEB3417357.1 flagellin [Salipiger manganoxidans]